MCHTIHIFIQTWCDGQTWCDRRRLTGELELGGAAAEQGRHPDQPQHGARPPHQDWESQPTGGQSWPGQNSERDYCYIHNTAGFTGSGGNLQKLICMIKTRHYMVNSGDRHAIRQSTKALVLILGDISCKL